MDVDLSCWSSMVHVQVVLGRYLVAKVKILEKWCGTEEKEIGDYHSTDTPEVRGSIRQTDREAQGRY